MEVLACSGGGMGGEVGATHRGNRMMSMWEANVCFSLFVQSVNELLARWLPRGPSLHWELISGREKIGGKSFECSAVNCIHVLYIQTHQWLYVHHTMDAHSLTLWRSLASQGCYRSLQLALWGQPFWKCHMMFLLHAGIAMTSRSLHETYTLHKNFHHVSYTSYLEICKTWQE